MTRETDKRGERATKPESLVALSHEDIVARRTITRRSALATLGFSLSAGALSTLLESCATYPSDADSYDGVSSNGGSPESSGHRHNRDIKLGDGSDYPVYADSSDLDSDARDTSDHFRERQTDRSSANDYD